MAPSSLTKFDAPHLSFKNLKHTSFCKMTTLQQEITLKPSPLRISTHVVTSSFKAKMDLDKLYRILYTRLIPIWYPGEGILKMEHGDTILGSSDRDCFTNRDISEHTFHNQM